MVLANLRCGCVLACGVLAGAALAAEQWGLHELTFKGPAVGNPYTEVRLAARFTQGAQSLDVLVIRSVPCGNTCAHLGLCHTSRLC